MRWLATAGLAGLSGFLLWRLFGEGRESSPDLARLERDFRRTLDGLLAKARKAGGDFVDINAGDLHRKVGGYPGPQHHMPLCCQVLREAMGPNDFAVREPRSGSGPSLTLRYHFAEDAAPA